MASAFRFFKAIASLIIILIVAISSLIITLGYPVPIMAYPFFGSFHKHNPSMTCFINITLPYFQHTLIRQVVKLQQHPIITCSLNKKSSFQPDPFMTSPCGSMSHRYHNLMKWPSYHLPFTICTIIGSSPLITCPMNGTRCLSRPAPIYSKV